MTDLKDHQPQIEAELRKAFTPRSSNAPAGAAAAPRLDPGLLSAILRELPTILSAIQRVLDSRQGNAPA